MTDESPKRRHWLQFRLRTLLITFMVLSLLLSWFAMTTERARRQREAVEEIERLGGHVLYDWASEAVRTGVEPPPPKSSHLRAVLGDDYFDEVVLVDLNVTPFTEDDLAPSNLEHLLRRHTRITGFRLEHLEALPNLMFLNLTNVQFTDAELESIKSLTKLERLELAHTQVTDGALDNLRGLTSLQILDLRDTQVTDAGLECLSGLANLQRLSLGSTQVTDEGIEKLREALPNCQIDY